MVVEFNKTNNQPATGFANEHLERLNHRLFEMFAVFRIEGIAVADAYVVL